jgi:hypothetical protein
MVVTIVRYWPVMIGNSEVLAEVALGPGKRRNHPSGYGVRASYRLAENRETGPMRNAAIQSRLAGAVRLARATSTERPDNLGTVRVSRLLPSSFSFQLRIPVFDQ